MTETTMPEPIGVCCPLAYVFRSSYERARRRVEAASGPAAARYWTGRAAETLGHWAEHQIEAHRAQAVPDRSCTACLEFELPGHPGGTTAEGWDHERRVHHVAHRLVARTIVQAG
ncbi:hypothetical protein ABT160_11805 [Streptomyces sp. NPDC001941]|uniref:hypothetical protein n=1 Tax=Streptomyces sp. NPDC001941 TaxID=3154659 RepID=UPI0033274A63